MFNWVKQIAAILRKVITIMDELELLKGKLSDVSAKLDGLGDTLSAETSELKIMLGELVENLKSDPVDLEPVIEQAEALAAKADSLDAAVKAISESVFPAPAEAPVE